MITIRATYSTPTTSPTVYYTALNLDGTQLTGRTHTGVTATTVTGEYFYDQLTSGAFIARWDEGDPNSYVDEWLAPLGISPPLGQGGTYTGGSATTTVPTMKAAFLTQLQARSGLTGVTVAQTLPPDLAGPYEILSLGGPVANQTTPKSMGIGAAQTYEEDYTLTVHISVAKNTDDDASTETRAYALMAEVENQLDLDPTIAGTVNVALRDGYESANRANANVRECFIAQRIRCIAEI